jgi:hypothetical protein
VKGTATSDRFIGQQVSAILAWKATAHLTIAFNYAHFIPGGSVKQAGGHSGDFLLAFRVGDIKVEVKPPCVVPNSFQTER